MAVLVASSGAVYSGKINMIGRPATQAAGAIVFESTMVKWRAVQDEIANPHVIEVEL